MSLFLLKDVLSFKYETQYMTDSCIVQRSLDLAFIF